MDKRKEMVERQLMPRGIGDKATLDAMGSVPREAFMPEDAKEQAYLDRAQPIGLNQTISQPYIVALMAQGAQIKPTDHVLEIGTGSGYGAAILSRMAQKVITVERLEPLALQAKERYKALGYENISVKVDDGTLGWVAEAPYDAILVTAAAPHIPPSLLKQLKIGGRLIIPVGDTQSQTLYRVTKKEEQHMEKEALEFVRFVPLLGEEGW